MTETLIQKYDLQEYVGSTPDRKKFSRAKRIHEILDEPLLPIETVVLDKRTRSKMLDELVDLSFPKLDLAFLTMKSPNKVKIDIDYGDWQVGVTVPRFGVININDSCMEMRGEFSTYRGRINSYEVHTDLHAPFKEYLQKTVCFPDQIDSKSDRFIPSGNYSYSLKTHFNGMLPREVKYFIINLNNKDVFPPRYSGGWSELFIIAEAKGWTGKASKNSSSADDPLLVGIRNEQCYLLKAFDCTPLEDYIGSEFITQKRTI